MIDGSPRPAATSACELAARLASSRPLRGAVAFRHHVSGRPAVHADLPPAMSTPRFDPWPALRAAGIGSLYTHQAEALAHIAAGRNVLTVTPTASGKSLVYILPTLRAVAEEPEARALYLFPYKALEQDQLGAIEAFIASSGLGGKVTAAIYDGDTPPKTRRRLRAEPPSVLITNPDMLHLGFLAHHDEWRRFFGSLRYIIVDELHVYGGIFGSHFHHVMRRLARVCRAHGSDPRFILSSATIGNPSEFASSLLGIDLTVVDASGAPRSGQHFLFVNPPAGSPYTAATFLIERCVREGFRTLAFTKARKVTELIASWLAGAAPDLAPRIASYRAGYLPSERRAIESRLQRGDLMGVVSTSALEHGIDIGGLDVCILVGYPGSITSSWQRIGRVGRAERESLVVFIALPDALDQYFMTHPREFFDRTFESVVSDPCNPTISAQHLTCAGAEIPLTSSDRAVYPETFHLVEQLAAEARLVADADGSSWYSLRRNPQRDISLRAAGTGYTIVDADRGRTIGSIGETRAFVECHEGALYLHQGQQFEVIELDRDRRRVTARRVHRDDYTQVLSEKQTEILEVLATRYTGGYRVSHGRIRVTQEFKEYVRKRIRDQRTISKHPLDLPPLVYETIGLWWEIPDDVKEAAAHASFHYMGSIHASEHAAISLFPLLTICDRNDIGGISYPVHPQVGRSAVFIYDGYPGGIGLAANGYARIETLLARTRDLIAGCTCEIGCPSCIHSPKCGSGNHPLDKGGARFVLDELTGRSRPEPPAPVIVPTQIRTSSPEITGVPPAPSRERPGTTRAPSIVSVPEGRVLFFDLETRRGAEEVGGWQRIPDMGLALAVVFDERRAEYRTYFEPDIDRLIVDLMSADQVVGFNVKRFDYTVLRGYREAAFDRIPTCDMLEQIHQKLGFRLKLNHLAEVTLGESKSADGLQSLEWFRQGRLDLIEEYCRKDVDVTRRLWYYGRRNGYLLYHDHQHRAMRVPVAW